MTTKLTALEANRVFYSNEASAYDATEVCVCRTSYQVRLRDALSLALSHLGPEPVVLDACGGAGNVGCALHAQGVLPVVVDVSPEMLERWRAKANALGVVPEIHEAAIEDFLRKDGRSWDLITFSSALHHLDDYTEVLRAAAANLTPGGLILTIFDPTLATSARRVLGRLDFVAWLAGARPSRFVELCIGAAQRVGRSTEAEKHVGRMAERYAYSGIDDERLVAAMVECGLEVLVHERRYDARLGVIRFLLRRMGQPSTFQLLLRRAP